MEPGTSGLHGGLPGPLGRPSKNNRPAPNRKQQQIISAVREGGKCGRSRAQRAQTAGNTAPDGLGTGQSEERILTPEALGSYRESQAGLFPRPQPPGLPRHPRAIITGDGQVLTTPGRAETAPPARGRDLCLPVGAPTWTAEAPKRTGHSPDWSNLCPWDGWEAPPAVTSLGRYLGRKAEAAGEAGLELPRLRAWS